MKNLIILLVLIIVVSCNSSKTTIDISGNWYSCARNGDYIEMFVNDNKYKYSSNFGTITHWDKYQISGDTLIQFNTNLLDDSLFINKALIEKNNDDRFILNYLTSVETWEMHRIKGDINIYKSDKKMLEETLQRAAIIACPDFRPEDEKQEKSIEETIEFQF